MHSDALLVVAVVIFALAFIVAVVERSIIAALTALGLGFFALAFLVT